MVRLGFAAALLGAASSSAATASLEKRAAEGVPQYVLDYAPLSYLHHSEAYFPASIPAHLTHVQPETNYTPITSAPDPLTLDNLDQLSDAVYLTSKDDVTTDPAWLRGSKPDCAGATGEDPTAAVVLVEKGTGILDAFYLYFYAYDWGGAYLSGAIQAGNHVGDWEHNMVRFENGTPTYVWYSQHSNGQAFAYKVLHKDGKRPLNYIANGTHANYAIPGTHDHAIPNLNLPAGLVEDHTDGPDTQGATRWDPLLGAWFFGYSNSSGSPVFTALGAGRGGAEGECAAAGAPTVDADAQVPTNWLLFEGKWGDQEYPESDPRQKDWFDGLLKRYGSGPTGPVRKQLGREKVCPDNGILCILRWVLGP
ncbi:uncharacterized protein K452DRAFT_283624 [Aplosporella prunicola CBS 121167]|uniref:Vacuolar protein sorting-associated protein 62 n=1 Tax=Aplosporella prunicola CBS 121167 TaxID=1176127 RepID=A0A6A6BU67_9PEZI|nr:uncharacterized protein K452DRAFT_283624 [Aplosporella prunicola CBS 121167]KAF2146347.1 hypothetical protein K452DRAFT_283624 [Aplosporella prunicola CBS 121167]